MFAKRYKTVGATYLGPERQGYNVRFVGCMLQSWRDDPVTSQCLRQLRHSYCNCSNYPKRPFFLMSFGHKDDSSFLTFWIRRFSLGQVTAGGGRQFARFGSFEGVHAWFSLEELESGS